MRYSQPSNSRKRQSFSSIHHTLKKESTLHIPTQKNIFGTTSSQSISDEIHLALKGIKSHLRNQSQNQKHQQELAQIFIVNQSLWKERKKNKLFAVIQSNINKVQKFQGFNILLAMIIKTKTRCSTLNRLVQHQINKSIVY